MGRGPLRLGFLLGALILFALFGTGASASPDRREALADSLSRRADSSWSRGTVEGRRSALADLEQATLVSPGRKDLWLALATRSIDAGRFARGRGCLVRAAKLAPDDFTVWFLLGAAWKRDWLASLDRGSLDEALRCFRHACAADPERFQGWTALAAVELLRGLPGEARAAALRAHQLAAGEPEPVRLLGAAFFRSGNLALADSAFRVADGLEPLTAPAGEWRGADPDLTTPENEAQLDYRTRLTLALFLFRDGDRLRWDERAELFVRYGPPAAIDFNSAGAQVGAQELSYRFPRHSYVRYAPDPIAFPFDAQVWSYPELGFQVTLWDRSLTQSYELPYSNDHELDPRPDPERILARADLAAYEGGKSVFRAMAPGATPMAIEGSATLFPLAGHSRLLGHLFADGGPADSVWGAWAVVDADGHVVSRDACSLSPSVCDPTERQVADFAAELPPGDYRLDFSARASRSRRGVLHVRVHVDSLPSRLAMSDLVLLCGEPATYVGPEGVRIEPNASARVSRNTLTAYYELDRLALDGQGNARFAYTYSIHALGRGHERHPAVLEATREEENVGPHRRQFLSVPIASLGPGEYQLRVEVRDLVAGTMTTGAVSFVRTR